MKPRAYIETTIMSYLKGRPSSDTIVGAHQKITNQWWNERASNFELLVSELVIGAAKAGDSEASRARLEALTNLQVLAITNDAVLLAQILVDQGPIPREYAADALHIAIAAVNNMDYLLTWNCKHLANATLRARIEDMVEEAGFVCPIICTPEELMED